MRRNKFLYDIQQEQSSYFMDRAIEMLDEDEFSASNPGKVEGTAIMGPLRAGHAADVASVDPSYYTDTFFRKQVDYLATHDDAFKTLKTPEAKAAYAHDKLNANNARLDPYRTDPYSDKNDPRYIDTSKRPQTLVGSAAYNSQGGNTTDTGNWWENPWVIGTTATLGIAAVGAGAYYLWKKWKEKGSIDENDKAMAVKIDREA